jgi:hypothetical protein
VAVTDEAIAESVCVGVRADAAAAAEAQECPVAQLAAGSSFATMMLAAVLGQLGVPGLTGESGEQATSVDLRQLPRVADEHQLAAGPRGVTGQPDEAAAARACQLHRRQRRFGG